MAVEHVNKVAIISGSTSGIGFATAKYLLEVGYYVYINGRDKQKCDEALSKLLTISTNVTCLVGDVSYIENYSSWLNIIEAKHKTVNLLVSNVGSGKYPNGHIIDVDVYQKAMQTNFFSAVSFCQGFLPILMKDSNIVLIGSIAGSAPLGAPTPYSCAKIALTMYMKEQALRFAEEGIRFNSISPGNVMFDGSTWDEKLQNNKNQTLEYIAKKVPLNRFVRPESIASMVLVIANTPEMTGQNVVIDGGQIVGQF